MSRGLVVRADACKARESEFDPSYFYPWFDGLEKNLETADQHDQE